MYSGGISGVPFEEINTHIIETKIKELAGVEQAHVALTLKGELLIDIEQKKPIVRVIDRSNNTFYLDEKGDSIPIDMGEAALVPIAHGNINPNMIKKVYTVALYVNENPTLHALVDQIFVDNKQEIIIVPKIHNHRIILGDDTRLNEKFSKLLKFYKNGLKKMGWHKYKTINLKYKNQVVCN